MCSSFVPVLGTANGVVSPARRYYADTELQVSQMGDFAHWAVVGELAYMRERRFHKHLLGVPAGALITIPAASRDAAASIESTGSSTSDPNTLLFFGLFPYRCGGTPLKRRCFTVCTLGNLATGPQHQNAHFCPSVEPSDESHRGKLAILLGVKYADMQLASVNKYPQPTHSCATYSAIYRAAHVPMQNHPRVCAALLGPRKTRV